MTVLLFLASALAAADLPRPVEIPFDYAVKNEAIPRDPVVQLNIKGRDALFLLDTGATGHVIDAGLARSLGLNAAPPQAGFDHYGSTEETRDLPDVPIEIGPWTGELTHPVAIARPPSLLRRGIVGTISPQVLLESGIVVLDLPGKTLTVFRSARVAAKKWLAARYPNYNFVELERQGKEMLIKAALPGRKAAPMLLDTGSGSTELSDVYMGLDPAVYRSTETITVGRHELLVHQVEVRSFREQSYMVGILGLDAIRGLILAFRVESSKVLVGFPRR